MSPDLGLRRRINQTLQDRPSRTLEEWYEVFWQPLSVSQDVTAFVYQQMEAYSGLQFGRVLPHDRLTEDLQIPLVCWFDWDFTLCEDFSDRFGIEIHDEFDPSKLSTVTDLVTFLNQQLISVSSS